MRFGTVGGLAQLLALATGLNLGGCGGEPAAGPGATGEVGPPPESVGTSANAAGDASGGPQPPESGGGVRPNGVSENPEQGMLMGWPAESPATADGPRPAADAGTEPGDPAAAFEMSPPRILLTGVRGLQAPVAGADAKLHNAGTTALTVTAIRVTGEDANLFALGAVPPLPVEVPAGADLPLTVELLTDGALPTAPPQNDGGTALSARVELETTAGAAEASVYALVLTTATHEPTLGQILDAAGFALNVGRAQDSANPNTGGTAALPGVEAGTDEIAAGLFRKAGPGNVSIDVIARFSPKGPMPFGWYPRGEPQTRNSVATLASSPDAQTSDKARMLLPPVTGAPSFDPGDQVFGIWVYTDQQSQRFDVGGNAANGDYNYSEDAPNSPPNVHRTKVYPLKNAQSEPVDGSYLLAIEEAANGDYQDYVLVLTNVEVAP